MKNVTIMSVMRSYSVNQARSIIRQAKHSRIVIPFCDHLDHRVRVAAERRLERSWPELSARGILAKAWAAYQLQPTVSPEVASMADRYGFSIEVVKAVLEAKGGDLKAAARSLAAKKARAAQDRPVLTDRGF